MSSSRNLPFARPMFGEQERAAVLKVLDGHILTHGPSCKEFEEKFAEAVGARHAVTTSSCTTALHLALASLDVGPGDEVIVPAETHVATAHAVEYCGARPVFVDVERSTGNIDPDLVSNALSAKTKAVIPVHYLGLPCRMDVLTDLASPLGVAIVEDCALSIGATFDGVSTGNFGIAGCFSFYPTKHMTSMEGGMLVTNDDGTAIKVRKQRAFGYDRSMAERSLPGIYDIDMLGYNYRMSEAQAAVGVVQLSKVDGFLVKRKTNSDILRDYVESMEGLAVFPFQVGGALSSRYCVNIMVEEGGLQNRDDLIRRLNASGVGTSVHYPVPLPASKYYRQKYGYHESDFPVASWISSSAISLPCGPHLGEDDMHYIGETLLKIVGEM